MLPPFVTLYTNPMITRQTGDVVSTMNDRNSFWGETLSTVANRKIISNSPWKRPRLMMVMMDLVDASNSLPLECS